MSDSRARKLLRKVRTKQISRISTYLLAPPDNIRGGDEDDDAGELALAKDAAAAVPLTTPAEDGTGLNAPRGVS